MHSLARLVLSLVAGLAAIEATAAAATLQDPIVPEVPRPVPQAPDQPVPKPAPVTVEHEPAPEKEPKKAPTVVAIKVQGAHRYTETQLVTALGQKVGEPYEMEAVNKGLDLLWKAFNVHGDVGMREVPGGVELLLRVEEMNSDLEPRFVGNKEIKTETLRHWALLDDKGELFLYQAERVRHRLLVGYHKEGYAFAEVDVVKRGATSGPVSQDELPDVIFEIREGPQVRVKDVVVHGSKTMPDTGMWWWKDGLKKLAQTELGGPWLFNWFGDKFIQETLDSDIVAMREVYRDRGYLDAVVALDHLQFSEDHTGVVIHIAVDEGMPYTVSSLHIKTVKHTPNAKTQDFDETDEPPLFAEADLLALCRMRPGERYERTKQNADSGKLRDYYGERGYLSAPSIGSDFFEFLEPELTFDPDAHTVAVVYKLAQGRKRYVREVIFRGATHTRDRVLRREIDMLPGDLADMTKIRAGLQNLYGTRFFTNESASSDHRDPQIEFKQTGNPDSVDVEYAVQEGKDINVQLQGGIDSDNGLFGRIALLLHNFDVADPPNSLWSTFGDLFDKEAFHGAGQELELELQPGTEVNSSLIRFLEPDIFGTEFNPWSLEVLWRRSRRDERFYQEDRNERRVRFGHQFSRHFSAYVGYVNTDVKVTDLDSPLGGFNDPDETPLPPSIYQQQGTTNLSGVTLDFTARNVDQFLNPHSGTQYGWHNIFYSTALGGDYDFVRSAVDGDWFWLTGGAETDDVRPGFHLGLNAGIADPFGDTSEVPYTERFFLGGSSTLRGFDRRGVGPNRGDNTLGGETALWGTFEYRYPLYSVTEPGTYRQKETFRLTLFTDAGVLGVDPWNVDPGEIRWTYGFGLGMVQPFPVSLNFGFPIRDGEGDRKQVFSFSILSLWF